MSDTVCDQALILLFKLICSTYLKKFVQGRKKIIYSLRGCVGRVYTHFSAHGSVHIPCGVSEIYCLPETPDAQGPPLQLIFSKPHNRKSAS